MYRRCSISTGVKSIFKGVNGSVVVAYLGTEIIGIIFFFGKDWNDLLSFSTPHPHIDRQPFLIFSSSEIRNSLVNMAEEGVTAGGQEAVSVGSQEDVTPGGQKREEWSSRWAFYFAGVGAAVGFGNVWRFPSLSVVYGGGAFFVPYGMCLLLVGIPLTILEIGFGQFFQTGDIGVFGGFHPRLRGVGLSSVACGFMLVTYYSVLIAWVLNAFFDSWSDNAPWGNENLTGEIAVNYFIDDVIGAGTLPADGTPTRIVGKNVGYSFLVWFLMYSATAVGIKWTGRLTFLTMGFPIVLLFVFLGTALTLEGADDGVKEYIGIWDMEILKTQGEVWSVACSQIFFSIGLTFGILTAYGSHCPRDEPVVLNSCVIAFSNSLFSIITGFAVFAGLGHLAHLEGVQVTDLDFAGFSLVFGTWPVVLNTLPGGAHWVRLLFLDLMLLGMDSAFAFLEAFITVLHDTVYFKDTPKHILLLPPTILGWLFSIIYCTDAGLNFLDVIDFYINFVMIVVGFFEAFGSGWAYGMVHQIELLGTAPVVSYICANFLSVFVACGLWFGVDIDSGAAWSGFVGLICTYLAGIAVTAYYLKARLTQDDMYTWKSIWWELGFGNIVRLRDRITPMIGPVPFLWCFLIKQFIPHVLIILFINLAKSDNGNGNPIFGGYGGYEDKPFQVMGILTFGFALVVVLIGAIAPKLYEPLALPQVADYGDNDDAAPPSTKKMSEEPGSGDAEKDAAPGGSEEELDEMAAVGADEAEA